VAHVIIVLCILTCDKYKSSLRHIHDPVLLSLKMKGIRLSFLVLIIANMATVRNVLVVFVKCTAVHVVRYIDHIMEE
jgi:hypothetical protein